MKIIFFGTPEFGAIILEEIVKSEYKPFLVVTAPDRPKGRKKILTPPPVKIKAQNYNIPLQQPEKVKNLKPKIENLKPDLGILAAYGQIIPKDILDIPKYGFLNVHPSLLPKYRGPSPIQYTILNGDKETGVSIILMDEKIDHGPIISTSKFSLQEQGNLKLTYEELNKKLAEIGAKLLIETIPKWLRGEIRPQSQDDSKATYTKIIRKEDGKIDWQKPAEVIEREIRAFNPWPSSYCFLEEKIIKILEADCIEENSEKTLEEAGKILEKTEQGEIIVQTGKGLLRIKKLQIEGGKVLSSADFLRGRNIIGKTLR
jgi:methionyl-tRNA formyltransferase